MRYLPIDGFTIECDVTLEGEEKDESDSGN
jgi:hypothetical protein